MGTLTIEIPNCWEGDPGLERARREVAHSRELLFDPRAGGPHSPACTWLSFLELRQLREIKWPKRTR